LRTRRSTLRMCAPRHLQFMVCSPPHFCVS